MTKHGCCDPCRDASRRTPLSTANRPGLDALRYRVGTHSSFFETMLRRLSTHRLPAGDRPLAGLTARTTDDPSIALLDGWATVADVLTIYQERIANEGYLLTATERRSILELARLTGYRPRPGVSASVYLAFEMEQDQNAEIPPGTRAHSTPEEPGDLPQSFETDQAIEGRFAWNALRPRMSRPTDLSLSLFGEGEFHVDGVLTGLKPNDPLLIHCGGSTSRRRVVQVEPDPEEDRTRIAFGDFHRTAPLASGEGSTLHAEFIQPGPELPPPMARLSGVIQGLLQEPSEPPPSRFQLVRPLDRVYGASSDLAPKLLTRFQPALRETLYTALAGARLAAPSPSGPCQVEALRVSAPVFGHNAPSPETSGASDTPHTGSASDLDISLDAVYEEILPGTQVVVERASTGGHLLRTVTAVRTRSRADYGISARVTELTLNANPWNGGSETLAIARDLTIHALPERLPLEEEPIEDPVEGSDLELDGLLDGLEPGRWLVVSGERADLVDVDGEPLEGVETSELVMLAGVEHDVQREEEDLSIGVDTHTRSTDSVHDGFEVGDRELPGDTLHTHLLLSEPLSYAYRRETVRINANVARASHGETHQEVLGSGDGSRSFQRFTLQRAPLTHLAAPTAAGSESTLEVRVDGVRWPESPSALLLNPSDRGYLTDRDDEERTTVMFGDGILGRRLPTGVENVTAVYRSGIGKAGNVSAGSINLLATQPAGVKGVQNPDASSGGADPETRDQARRNVPLALQALDRLVSVADYTHFARTFAGIGKADARHLPDGRRQVVHLTIAGAEDAPIDTASELFRNLMRALRRLGDPGVALRVARREAVFLFLGAGVRVHADHRWEEVEPALRSALLDAFGFERMELGRGVRLGEILAVMQAIPGVEHVDVDFLDGLSEEDAFDPDRLAALLDGLTSGAGGSDPCRPRRFVPARPARIDPSATDPDLRLRPAQIAFLNPDLPDTLILTELEER